MEKVKKGKHGPSNPFKKPKNSRESVEKSDNDVLEISIANDEFCDTYSEQRSVANTIKGARLKSVVSKVDNTNKATRQNSVKETLLARVEEDSRIYCRKLHKNHKSKRNSNRNTSKKQKLITKFKNSYSEIDKKTSHKKKHIHSQKHTSTNASKSSHNLHKTNDLHSSVNARQCTPTISCTIHNPIHTAHSISNIHEEP